MLDAWASGQSVNLQIEGETTIVVKKLPFTITAPTGYRSYRWTHPSSVKSKKNKNVITITSAPPGEITVEVAAFKINDRKDDIDEIEGAITFSVGTAPVPPPPGPDPEPWPPEPDDPLLGSLRAAYGADMSTTKATDARKLAAVWRAAADDAYLKRAGTWQNLLADMHTAAESQIAGKLKPIRSALSAEAKTLVALDEKTTNGGSVKAKALLLRFAGLLEAMIAPGRKVK